MTTQNYREFTNELFGMVRALKDGEKVLFCAKDVADALGYEKSRNAISRHCRYALKRGVTTNSANRYDSFERETEMLFIPEGDVYRLIIRSKLPDAEKFERWLFDEVLPELRRNGGYVLDCRVFVDKLIPDADTATKEAFVGSLEALRGQSEVIAEQNEIIGSQKDAVEFAEHVSVEKAAMEIGDFAKFLHDREKLDIGRTRLFKWLREHKYLNLYNMPYQRSLQEGWFKVSRRTRRNVYGDYEPYTVTMVTGKGQIYLTKKLLEAAAAGKGR